MRGVERGAAAYCEGLYEGTAEIPGNVPETAEL